MNMKMSTNPSTNANWTYNFIAEDVELLDSKQHLDGGECLTVHLLTLDEIKRLLKENGIISRCTPGALLGNTLPKTICFDNYDAKAPAFWRGMFL